MSGAERRARLARIRKRSCGAGVVVATQTLALRLSDLWSV
jgi:hypothetical protein